MICICRNTITTSKCRRLFPLKSWCFLQNVYTQICKPLPPMEELHESLRVWMSNSANFYVSKPLFRLGALPTACWYANDILTTRRFFVVNKSLNTSKVQERKHVCFTSKNATYKLGSQPFDPNSGDFWDFLVAEIHPEGGRSLGSASHQHVLSFLGPFKTGIQDVGWKSWHIRSMYGI